MTIKEIIQKLHITMIDAGGQESHFQSWLTLSEGIIDVIDALKALDKQEPVGQLLEDAFGRGQVMWFNKPKDESMLYTTPPQRTKQEPVAFASHGVINWIADKQFQHEADLYTTPPQHESTCAECDKNQSDGWALYCVDCLREFYKHDPTNKRTWVGLTDDEIYKIAVTLEGEHWKKIADAIEAKLRSKNNG